MKKQRRAHNHTEEFKRRAVHLYRTRGRREVKDILRELEIAGSQLGRWVHQYPEEGVAPAATAKVARQAAPPERAAPSPTSSLEAERLRREIASLERECVVLKNTA